MTVRAGIEQLLMVADIAHTVNDFRPLQETLDRICERASLLSGFNFAAVLLPDAERKSLIIRGSWGLNEAYIRHINEERAIRLEDEGALGLAPTAQAYRTGLTVSMSDIEREPAFDPWREGARRLGYRSIACVPVIVRSSVIGVLNCYGHTVHVHTAEDLEVLQVVARMAGTAIETAQIAQGQRVAMNDLRQANQRLQIQAQEMSRLARIQNLLVEQLAAGTGHTVERTAMALSEITEGSVLIMLRSAHVLAFSGAADDREAMILVGTKSHVGERLRHERMIAADGCTCVRIGTDTSPLGVLTVKPAIAETSTVARMASVYAAAVVSAEIQTQRADRTLDSYARPAMLLALVHGLLAEHQIREAAGVLGVAADSPVRLAVLRCPTPEAAQRVSHRPATLRDAGWPVFAATSSRQDALLLLKPVSIAELHAAAATIRERRLEIEAIGVSAVLHGLGALSSGRIQARVAASASRGRAMVIYDDLGPIGSLLGDLDHGRLREIRRALEPIRQHDFQHGTEYLQALTTYVRCSGRIAEGAALLGIQPRTLRQRIRHAERLAKIDLRDFAHLARLMVALESDAFLQGEC